MRILRQSIRRSENNEKVAGGNAGVWRLVWQESDGIIDNEKRVLKDVDCEFEVPEESIIYRNWNLILFFRSRALLVDARKKETLGLDVISSYSWFRNRKMSGRGSSMYVSGESRRRLTPSGDYSDLHSSRERDRRKVGNSWLVRVTTKESGFWSGESDW